MSTYRRKLSRYEALLKRNDGAEAVKEDGRNEYHPGNTAWIHLKDLAYVKMLQAAPTAR